MNAFAALADPTRLSIFELLAQGEKNVGELVKEFTFTAPTISQHLKVLKRANLVTVRAEGQKRIYAVNQQELAHMQAWLDQMRRQWNTHLDSLERVLEEEKQKSKGNR